MKFCADILPGDACKNIAFEIDQAHGNMNKPIEIIHERLDRWNINNISQLKVCHLTNFTSRRFFFKFSPATYIESVNVYAFFSGTE